MVVLAKSIFPGGPLGTTFGKRQISRDREIEGSRTLSMFFAGVRFLYGETHFWRLNLTPEGFQLLHLVRKVPGCPNEVRREA